MNQLQVIREDKQLRILLMQECDILFYDQLKEVEFSQNNEVYSLSPIAFAKDVRTPLFTCKYGDAEDEYVCDSILSDIIGLWVSELVGMSREEMMNFGN